VTFNFSPYKFDGYEEKPSSFFIRFLIDHREYEYAFALTRNEIIKESLHYYKVGKRKTRTRIFERDEHAGKTKREKYKFSTLIKRPFDVAENTSKKTLYIVSVRAITCFVPVVSTGGWVLGCGAQRALYRGYGPACL